MFVCVHISAPASAKKKQQKKQKSVHFSETLVMTRHIEASVTSQHGVGGGTRLSRDLPRISEKEDESEIEKAWREMNEDGDMVKSSFFQVRF